MSELILSWLNDELQLSRRVTSFEHDFTNGFLFGEILARYNQQLNFGEFLDRDDKDSRLRNFTLLFQTFRTLRIGFDSNLVTQIIEGKEGVSKKILYELKMHLEKSATNYFSKAPKSGLTPLKKVQVGKEIKDQLDAEFFKKRLQETHRAQKRINEENVLKKFSDFHKSQLEKNKQEMLVEEQKALAVRDAIRDERRTTLKRATDFRNQWEKSNGDKWLKNMEVRKMNHETDVLYRSKLEALKKKSESEKEDQALKQVSSEIEEFERKFSKKSEEEDQPVAAESPSQSPTPRQEAGRMTQTLKEKSLGRSIPTATMRLKKNPELEEISRRERDKRRRKMIVDLNKHQNLIEIEKREQQIMFCLQQTSKQEKEIEYELWRAWQNKQVIIENRRLRDSKYAEKAELKQANTKFKDEELLRTYREEHAEDLRTRMAKQNELHSIAKVDARKQLYGRCRDMVLQLLEVAENCYEHQQNTNHSDIHGEYLNEMIQQFVAKTETPKQIAEQEMKDYIGGRNYWAVQVQRDAGQPVEADKDGALPDTALNNYYLGNVLKLLFGKHFTQAESTAEETKTAFKPELGACLIGLEFAGKKTAAEHLAKEYDLKVVRVDSIIQERLNSFASLTETNLGVSETTAQLVQLCQKGSNLPNELLVELVEQEVRKHPRFLLVDFPQTYQQAVMLSKRLTGIAPNDHTQRSALQTKIQQFSRLVLPTETTWIKRSVRSCGLDMLLWMDIGPEESLDRCIGRRWIGERVYHINDEIGSEVNDLQVGDRGASTVERNNFKRNNLPELKSWYENFGLAAEEADGDSYQFICWQEIDARPRQPAVTEAVSAMMERLLSYKKRFNSHIEGLKERQKQQALEEEERKQKDEAIRKKCILSTPEQLQQQLALAQSKNSLNPNFISACINLWNKLENNTVEAYLRAFEGMREQRESSITRLASLKRRFIGQLLRQDSKFNLSKQFQLEYNKFVEGNSDMVEEEQTKEELHQRIDDLEDQLKEITEGKRDEAADERTQIMNSGWLESRLERYYMYVQLLVATEIERSLGCQQLLSDYYCAAYSIEAKEMVDVNNDLNVDPALQIINTEFECPRIDKLFSEGMRVFNRQEPEAPVDDKNKKGGKAPPPPKKDDKKTGKKGGKEQPEEKKEATPQELEMQAAVNTEKSIFRFRLNILKQIAKRELKSIKQQSLDFYAQLEDLLRYTYQVELEAIDRLSKLLREKVEQQAKVQTELQLNYVDVKVRKEVLNYLTPKPQIQPARELSDPNRFTVSQLQFLLRNIEAESEKLQRLIVNRKLLTLLTRFTTHKQINRYLPSSWLKHTFADYERLISRLDFSKLGSVHIKDLFTVIVLTDCKLPTPEQLSQYRKELEKMAVEGRITSDKFVKVPAWFDKSQTQQPRQHTNVFDRPAHLKKFLFDAIADPHTQQLGIDRLLDTLSLSRLAKRPAAGSTYYAAIFQ